MCTKCQANRNFRRPLLKSIWNIVIIPLYTQINNKNRNEQTQKKKTNWLNKNNTKQPYKKKANRTFCQRDIHTDTRFAQTKRRNEKTTHDILNAQKAN